MITGAREGIGAACAQEFTRRGARLSLIDVAPKSRITTTATRCGLSEMSRMKRYAARLSLLPSGILVRSIFLSTTPVSACMPVHRKAHP